MSGEHSIGDNVDIRDWTFSEPSVVQQIAELKQRVAELARQIDKLRVSVESLDTPSVNRLQLASD